jgi:hypothetical protein
MNEKIKMRSEKSKFLSGKKEVSHSWIPRVVGGIAGSDHKVIYTE